MQVNAIGWLDITWHGLRRLTAKIKHLGVNYLKTGSNSNRYASKIRRMGMKQVGGIETGFINQILYVLLIDKNLTCISVYSLWSSTQARDSRSRYLSDDYLLPRFFTLCSTTIKRNNLDVCIKKGSLIEIYISSLSICINCLYTSNYIKQKKNHQPNILIELFPLIISFQYTRSN